MKNEPDTFNKDILIPYLEHWSSNREKIELAYEQKDHSAVDMMEVAIALYDEMLLHGGIEHDERSQLNVSKLLPLNGTERLQFVKDKVRSHYSFVQLDALFLETKKKAARLSLKSKKTEA